MRRSFRRAVAALAGVALTLPSAACGGGGTNAGSNRYINAVNAAQNDFAQRFNRLSTRITATSTPQQDRRTLGQFEVAVEAVVRRLRAVHPPARVEGLHRRLIAQIGGYGGQIAAARRAFASRDRQRVLAAQGRLVGAVNDTGARVNRTIDQINHRLGAG
jgi:hypothetical protein